MTLIRCVQWVKSEWSLNQWNWLSFVCVELVKRNLNELDFHNWIKGLRKFTGKIDLFDNDSEWSTRSTSLNESHWSICKLLNFENIIGVCYVCACCHQMTVYSFFNYLTRDPEFHLAPQLLGITNLVHQIDKGLARSMDTQQFSISFSKLLNAFQHQKC